MNQKELVYRELLYQALEKQNFQSTQLSLARRLQLSLSVINYALQPLRKMGAISVATRSFTMTDLGKILYYWASCRNLTKDIIYQTRVEKPLRSIESEMPEGAVFAAYSAYKFRWEDVPADYSEIYVYASQQEIQKRFPPTEKKPNLFVLKKDALLAEYGRITTIAQTFVDLWNLPEWYAQDFLKAIKKKIEV